MELHIGSIIKRVAEEKRIGPTELGSKINTSKQNIYGIFKRQSVDTKLLLKLCYALEYDFFMEYVRVLKMSQSPHPSPQGGGLNGEMHALQKELEFMRKQNEILQRVIDDYLEEKAAGREA